MKYFVATFIALTSLVSFAKPDVSAFFAAAGGRYSLVSSSNSNCAATLDVINDARGFLAIMDAQRYKGSIGLENVNRGSENDGTIAFPETGKIKVTLKNDVLSKVKKVCLFLKCQTAEKIEIRAEAVQTILSLQEYGQVCQYQK